MENGLEQQVLAKAQKWLDGNYDAETKKQELKTNMLYDILNENLLY